MFNFKNATIGTKIFIGFGVLIVLTMALSFFSFLGADKIIGNATIVSAGYRLDGILAQKEIDHLNWVNKITALITDDSVTSLTLEDNDHKCGFGKWLYGENRIAFEQDISELAPLFKKIERPHLLLHQSAVAIKSALKKDNDRSVWLPHVEKIFLQDTKPALSEVQELLHQARNVAHTNIITDTAMVASARQFKSGVLIIGLLVVVLGVVLSSLQVKSLSKTLKMITDGIRNNAKEVTEASLHMSSISQELASASQEQALTLDNTSSAIEELSASSKITSELTKGSDLLMKQNIEHSGQSLKALVELTASMSQIEQDSDKISQIIKTIDNIAFQTNLLALNAAVEAARAGEAGAGFAVVAAEVKNLATRSAESAKDTQELLDLIISRVSVSASALKDINTDFDEIVNTATCIGEKNLSITQATEEQAVGLEHITSSTLDIDQVTQHVTATASESASTSEKLSEQAEEMNIMVNQLVGMVYGKKLVQTSGSSLGGSGRGALCWDVKNCPTSRRNSCPAYPNNGSDCWGVTATLCGGEEQGTYHEKMASCRKCELYRLNTTGVSSTKSLNKVTCWDIKECPSDRRDSCPAYPNTGGQCWMVTGTLCGGSEQGTYHEKMAKCRKCNVYEMANEDGGQLKLVDFRNTA